MKPPTPETKEKKVVGHTGRQLDSCNLHIHGCQVRRCNRSVHSAPSLSVSPSHVARGDWHGCRPYADSIKHCTRTCWHASPQLCLGCITTCHAHRARDGIIPQGTQSVSSAITTTSLSGRLRICSMVQHGGERVGIRSRYR